MINREHFEGAVFIALSIEKGCYRRFAYEGVPTDYKGYKDECGRCFVIAETIEQLPNTNSEPLNYPTIEVSKQDITLPENLKLIGKY